MAFPGFRSSCGSSFTAGFSNTDHSSAAIPHDTADIHEVEADQTEWMVGQGRCSASLGSLVLVLRSFDRHRDKDGGASWFAPRGASSSTCHGLVAGKRDP